MFCEPAPSCWARQRGKKGPTVEPIAEAAYANLDRLSCLEIQGAALPHGVKTGLYEAAREAEGESLTLAGARLLDRPYSHIGIVTGAAVPDHMPAGENDGPLGSVVLARALIGMGHRVSLYTDPPAAPPIEALAARYGLDAPTVHLGLHDTVQQEAIAAELDVAVAVERHGGNPHGNLYGVTGTPRHPFRLECGPPVHDNDRVRQTDPSVSATAAMRSASARSMTGFARACRNTT